MQCQVMWQRTCAACAVAVAAGLLCGTTTPSPAVGAPLDVPSLNRNDTGKPKIQSALYDDRTVSVFVIPGHTVEKGEPTLLLTAMIEIEVLLPDRTEAITTKVSSLMLVGKEDAAEFPDPMKILLSDQDIQTAKINSIDEQQGLAQLRAFCRTAVEGEENQEAAAPAAESEPAAKPEIQSARFDPDTVSVYVLPAKTKEEHAAPTVLLSAMISMEFLYPGAFLPEMTEVSSMMLIDQDDLHEFPGPMKMLQSDQNILTFKIDTIDQEKGLERIREAYNTAIAVQRLTAEPPSAGDP